MRSDALMVDAFRLPAHAGDGHRVRPLGCGPGSTATGLQALLALTLGDRHAVCGCIPATSGTRSSNARKAMKRTLVELLMGFLPDDGRFGSRSRRPVSVELGVGSLGKPTLHVGGVPGPSVSFSIGAETMWAAICGKGCCGIDSADPEEFPEGYPFHRAFRDGEIQSILDVIGGTRNQAAALVWSAKEAAVKALGFGFHVIDPLGVRVRFVRTQGVSLLSKAVVRSRFGTKVGAEREIIVPVLTFRFGNTWISAAFADDGLRGGSFRVTGRPGIMEE